MIYILSLFNKKDVTEMKQEYKKHIVSMLTVVTLTGAVMPTYISASEAPKMVVNQSIEYALGPEGLKEALTKTGSNMLIMDLYALMMLKQREIDLQGIDCISVDLKKDISKNEQQLKQSAELWLDGVKPNLIKTAQRIAEFDSYFESYYQTLQQAIQTKNKNTLIQGLTKLANNARAQSIEAEYLLEELKEYRNAYGEPLKIFKRDVNMIIDSITSKNIELHLITQRFDAYYESVNKYNKILIAGVISTVIGTLTIVGGVVICITGVGLPLGLALIGGGVTVAIPGGVAVRSAKQAIEEANLDFKKLQTQNKKIELEIVQLNQIKNQVTSYIENIDIAITSLQNITNHWQVIHTQYDSLIKNIEYLTPEQMTFIQEDLQVAYEGWKGIKSSVTNFLNSNIQINQEELNK